MPTPSHSILTDKATYNDEKDKMRKLAMAALAVLTLAGTTAVTTTAAEARGRGHHHHHHHGHRHGGWGIGAGIATGLALGAVGAGYYGYHNGCIRNRVVGHTAYGQPIVRRVNVCY